MEVNNFFKLLGQRYDKIKEECENDVSLTKEEKNVVSQYLTKFLERFRLDLCGKTELANRPDDGEYRLFGDDYGAFSYIRYTASVLKAEGLNQEVQDMVHKTLGLLNDYDELQRTCIEYIDMANDTARKRSIEEKERAEYERLKAKFEPTD